MWTGFAGFRALEHYTVKYNKSHHVNHTRYNVYTLDNPFYVSIYHMSK